MTATKERVKGECVNWYKQKGFGFIRVDDGETVFVHKKDLQDAELLNFGDRVEFVVKVNPKTKKKSAVHVTVIEDEREPETFVVDDEQQKGVIKMYYKLKGYGFIKRDGQDKDVRFEMKDASFVDGDSVLFQIATGARGSIRAWNVILDPQVSRERVKGECTWWNEDKSFGFIRLDDGEDAFVHYLNIQGGDTLNIGDRVECEVGVNSKKKKNAVRVTVIEDEREPETFVVHEGLYHGVIWSYFQEDGYGFIKRGGQNKNIRFEMNDAGFVKGNAVAFQIATGSRGSVQAQNVTFASHVRVIEAEPETNRKRKLEGSGDVSPPTKKRKTDDGAAAFLSEEDSE